MANTAIEAIDQQLEGVGIIERDDHNDVIMTWCVKEPSKTQLKFVTHQN